MKKHIVKIAKQHGFENENNRWSVNNLQRIANNKIDDVMSEKQAIVEKAVELANGKGAPKDALPKHDLNKFYALDDVYDYYNDVRVKCWEFLAS